MLRHKNTFIKFLVDLISIPFIVVVAYSLKFKIGWTLQHVFKLSYGAIYQHAQVENYLENIAVITLIWVISLYSSGLYTSYKGVMAEVDEFIKIFKSVSAAIILLTTISFFVPIIPHSRFVILYGWITGIIWFSFTRYLLNSYLQLNKSKKQCIVVGSSQNALTLSERICMNSEFDFRYLGNFSNNTATDIPFTLQKHYRYLGDFDALFTRVLSDEIEAIFVEKDELTEQELSRLIIFCEEHFIEFFIHHPLSNALSGVATYQDIAGMPLLSYKPLQFSAQDSFIKRFFDIISSLLLLITLSPLFVFTAIWIRLTSKGPILFRQTRVGLYNKTFEIIKFRTMPVNAEEKSGPTWADNSETRYIKGGKFLRKYSIDELPQLFNVLKNDMSLIGPRPERPYFVDEICKEAPYFTLRHQIKGGLSGWAQIHGRSYLTKKPIEKFKYDLYYIKNWSLVLDIKIVIKSFFIVLKGEEAY